MIRQDYFLRMLEQCVQALARITGLARQSEYAQARTELEQTLRNLAGLDSSQITRLSEAELLALLLADEPTRMLRDKVMIMVALLRQAGEIDRASRANVNAGIAVSGFQRDIVRIAPGTEVALAGM